MATLDSTPRTIEIQLTKGHTTVIDEIDSDLQSMSWHAWQYTDRPYAQTNIKINGKFKSKKLHRMIMERVLSRPLGKSECVDHVDNDSLNNRRSNLRVCTVAQNVKNKSVYSNNKLRLKGVYERGGKYRAQIQVDRRKIMLGTYDTPEEAHRAYCEAAVKYHKEFARFQ